MRPFPLPRPSAVRLGAAGTGWRPRRPLSSPALSGGPEQWPRTPAAGGGAGNSGGASRSPARVGWEPGAVRGQVSPCRRAGCRGGVVW